MAVRDQGATPYIQSEIPLIPGGEDRYYQTEFTKVATSSKSIADMTPQPAVAAPKIPRDGMIRLARSPWRPIGGTADVFVYYDLPSATWKAL